MTNSDDHSRNDARWVHAAIALVVACGSSDDAPSTDANSADDAGSVERSGAIFIQGMTTPLALTVVGANFFTVKPTGGTTRTDGTCVIRTGTASGGQFAKAGDMTVTRGADVLMLDQTDNGYLGGGSSTQYAPGDTLVIAASGDVVPAFSTTLTYPQLVSVTTPPPPALGQGIDVSKTGFSAAWTGSAPFEITISQDTTKVSIVCTYAGANAATIPATALADLASGMKVDVLMSTTASGSFDAGAFAIDTQAAHVVFFAVEGVVQ